MWQTRNSLAANHLQTRWVHLKLRRLNVLYGGKQPICKAAAHKGSYFNPPGSPEKVSYLFPFLPVKGLFTRQHSLQTTWGSQEHTKSPSPKARTGQALIMRWFRRLDSSREDLGSTEGPQSGQFFMSARDLVFNKKMFTVSVLILSNREGILLSNFALTPWEIY